MTRPEVPDDARDEAIEADVADQREPSPNARPTSAEHAPRGVARSKMLTILLVAVVGLVVVGVVAVVIAGDTRDTSDEPSLAGGWEMIEEPAGLDSLSLSEEPLWTNEGGPLDAVGGAVFRDDVAVLSGQEISRGSILSPSLSYEMAVVDAATGTPRWTIGSAGELPGGDGAIWKQLEGASLGPNVIDQPGGWAVLVAYRGVAEEGVAALSPDDGHVLWRLPLVSLDTTGLQLPETGILEVMTSEDLALVRLNPSQPDLSNADHLDEQRVVAIDLTSRTVLWELTGVMPETIVGNTVLAHDGVYDTPYDRMSSENESPVGPDLVAMDAGSGRTLWDLSERFRFSELVVAAGDIALVGAPDEGATPTDDALDTAEGPLFPGTEALAIDLETGREVESLGTNIRGACHTDETSFIACPSTPEGDRGGDRVVTIGLDDHEVGVSETAFGGLSIDGVWSRRIFVTDDNRHRSVDRSGTTVDDAVPGDFLAMSEEYVIFACGPLLDPCAGGEDDSDPESRYAIYRLE